MKNLILGEQIEIKKGKKHSLAEKIHEKSHRYLQIGDLRNNDYLKYTNDNFGVDIIPSDLLIAWDGANAGTIGYGLKGKLGSTLARLRLKENIKIDSVFLGIFLQSQFHYLRRTATGATIPHINRKVLEKIELPNIDVENQKRIAKVLSNCENLIQRRKESIGLLDELIKSTFLEMFGDPVRNDKKLKFVSLAKYGDFKNGLNYSKNEVGLKVRYLGVGDFKKHNRISDMHLLKEISLSKKPSDDYFLKDGDLVFVRSNGNKVLVGRCVVVNPEKEKVTFSGFCIRFRPKSELLNTLYLSHLFTIENFKKKMLQSGRGANIQNINQKLLGELKIPLPSLQLQNKFVEVVEKVETLKQKYQTHLQELENLYGGISQKAFKGELDLSKVVLDEDLTPSNQNTKPIKNIKSKLEESYPNKLEPKVNLVDQPIVNELFKNSPLYFKIALIEYFKYNQGTYQDFISDYISRFENRNRYLDHEQLKVEIFKLLDVNRPKLIQYFDEIDNTVKLKLTDEANKA